MHLEKKVTCEIDLDQLFDFDCDSRAEFIVVNQCPLNSLIESGWLTMVSPVSIGKLDNYLQVNFGQTYHIFNMNT